MREDKLIENMFAENKALTKKLAKANKRCNYLIRAIKKLKKEREPETRRDTFHHKQKDKEARDVQRTYGGTSSDRGRNNNRSSLHSRDGSGDM